MTLENVRPGVCAAMSSRFVMPRCSICAVLNVLKEVNEQLGATVVLVTHAASQAAMADRVIHFADGNVRKVVVNKAKRSPEEIEW